MYWDSTVKVSSTNFSTSSTSLVDITGISFAASSNSLYELEIVFRVQSSDSSGIKMGIQYSTAGATGAIVYEGTNNVGTVVTGGNTTLNTLSSTFLIAATTDGIIFAKAIMVTGANAGNITMQVAKVTSGTATVYIGSVMKIKKLA